MASEAPLSQQVFLRLAAEAGLDVHNSHMDELYSYVQVVFDGLRPLHNLNVTGTEPDMAFLPSHE